MWVCVIGGVLMLVNRRERALSTGGGGRRKTQESSTSDERSEVRVDAARGYSVRLPNILTYHKQPVTATMRTMVANTMSVIRLGIWKSPQPRRAKTLVRLRRTEVCHDSIAFVPGHFLTLQVVCQLLSESRSP